MKNIFIIVIATILLINEIYSQNFIYDLRDLSTKPDTSFNLYNLTNNPALLSYDLDDEKLKTTFFFNSSNNYLRRFFVPEKTDFYEIHFSGKKRIGENQIFKGKFSFNKEIRKNWNWIFTKDFKSGNPFLLGDSSSGSSIFNGIYFDANYFNQLTEKSTLGAQLEYFVDEGLKKVSPKPTSQHRIIRFKLGGSYDLFDFLKGGIDVQIIDSKEEISYKEDESAVYKEITLFKFQGYAFPIVVKKKTETRLGYFNAYSVDGHFLFNPLAKFQIMGNLNKGIEQIIQKEEVNNPQSRGHFENDYLRLNVMSNFNFTDKLDHILQIEYFTSESWSRHPDYFVTLSENYQKFFIIKGIFNYKFTSDLLLFTGVGAGKLKMNLRDYYGDVYFDLKSNLYSFLSGLKFNFSEKIMIRSALSLEKNLVKNSGLRYFNTGYYFSSFQENDFEYFTTDYFKYEFSISTQLVVKDGEFVLELSYIDLMPKKENIKTKNNNSSIKSILIYRTKIY